MVDESEPDGIRIWVLGMRFWLGLYMPGLRYLTARATFMWMYLSRMSRVKSYEDVVNTEVLSVNRPLQGTRTASPSPCQSFLEQSFGTGLVAESGTRVPTVTGRFRLFTYSVLTLGMSVSLSQLFQTNSKSTCFVLRGRQLQLKPVVDGGAQPRDVPYIRLILSVRSLDPPGRSTK